MTRIRTIAYAAILASSLATAAAAQTPEEFYKGKTVTLLIGFGSGGDDDAWSHLVAQFLSKHLAGNPTVVPENVPGAGSLLVANRVYNTAPKDGTVIGNISRGVPFEPLLGGKGTQFDAQKMSYIGSPAFDTPVCAARKDAPVQTMADLKDKELIVGATGSGADTATYPEFLSQLLALKFSIIRGYPGSNQIGVAIERGELQGICVSYDTLNKQAMFLQGKMNVLFQAALQSDPRLDGVPLVIDEAKGEPERQALTLFLQRTLVGRPYVAPPNIPADRLAALRKAFAETVQDPEFVAAAEKQKLHPHLTTGEDEAKVVADAYKTPPDVVLKVAQLIGYKK